MDCFFRVVVYNSSRGSKNEQRKRMNRNGRKKNTKSAGRKGEKQTDGSAAKEKLSKRVGETAGEI